MVWWCGVTVPLCDGYVIYGLRIQEMDNAKQEGKGGG